MSRYPILSPKYFQNDDVLFLSKDLLGKFLMTNIAGKRTGGMIIETEAYRAPEDRASHAYNYRRTKRNASMYKKGGICYVYQCYGIHALFNIVTNDHEIPHGILIRAIWPTDGVEIMLKRRRREKLDAIVAGGPGKLTEALGITTADDGTLLTGPKIWVEDRGVKIDPETIIAGPRVGIDFAGEDALLPWRFRINHP